MLGKTNQAADAPSRYPLINNDLNTIDAEDYIEVLMVSSIDNAKKYTIWNYMATTSEWDEKRSSFIWAIQLRLEWFHFEQIKSSGIPVLLWRFMYISLANDVMLLLPGFRASYA